MTRSPLPITVAPLPRESIRGYLLRLANANGYTQPNWLKALPALHDYLWTLCGSQLFGRVPAMMRRPHLPDLFWPDMYARYNLGSSVHYCPSCLSESAYWRMEWEHPFYTACHIHQVQMLDHCPNCTRPTNWNHPLDRCLCGQPFASAKLVPAEQEECWMASQIVANLEKSLDGQSTHPSKFDRFVEAANWEGLIHTLGTTVIATQQGHYPEQCSTHQLETARNIVIQAVRILAAWPTAFHDLLWDVSRAEGALLPGTRYPRLFNQLARALRTRYPIRVVERELSRFQRDHGPGVLTRRNRWPTDEDMKGQRFTTMAGAAQFLKMATLRLQCFIDDGSLEALTRVSATGRTLTLINSAELLQLQDRLAQVVSRRTVASILGINRQRVICLVKAGLLTPCKPHEGAGLGLHFWRDKVISLKMVFCHDLPVLAEQAGLVTGLNVMKSILDSEEAFTSFVLALRKGAICPVGILEPDAGVSGLLFSCHELHEWTTRQRKQALNYTLTEAAQQLELKEEVVYSLAKSGLLRTHLGQTGRRRSLQVSHDDIMAFRGGFISGAELAPKFGTSPKNLRSLLEEFGVHPVSGPGIDECRQYFYSRSFFYS